MAKFFSSLAVSFLCFFLLFPLCLPVSASSSSYSLPTYDIEGKLKLPRTGLRSPASSFYSQARVLVNGGEYITLVKADGSFVIHDLPSGIYTLDVSLVDFVFQTIRVEVSSGSSGQLKVKAIGVFHRDRVPYPLEWSAESPARYYQIREPYDFSSIYKNPMMLMMGFTALMVVVFPRLVGNMDPEELKQMKQMQSKMSLTGMLKDLQDKANDANQPGKGATKHRIKDRD